MFTGIVQDVGRVVSLEKRGGDVAERGFRLRVHGACWVHALCPALCQPAAGRGFSPAV